MAREWFSTCKDCGKKYGYSDSSQELSNQRGISRPERCPECRKLHSREIASLGLSHFELQPLVPLPETGLARGRLGGLKRPPRVHKVDEKQSTFNFDLFAIKDHHIREYLTVMQQHQVMVIVAPTGSGKSTVFPYRLMMPPEGIDPDIITRHGPIIVTQPRVQATRNIPDFVAKSLHGSSLGPGFDIGFRHHGRNLTDWRNKLVFMTDGTLINMIVRNELNKVGLIMIDEAHERSLNIDLILGLLRVQLRRYPHLRLVIASATIDTALFMHYFGAPTSFDPENFKWETEEGIFYDNEAIERQLTESPVGFYGFPGKRQHKIEVRFRQDNPVPLEQMSGRMPEEVADKVYEILNDIIEEREPHGDILAFLHGEKPIERACSLIREKVDEDSRLAGKIDVLPLYTRLPQASQDAALKPKKDEKRIRVVVSTNVAETSLTVEGIVHVVETGLINESQWDPQTQTSFVVPRIHSRAGCRQRWGRAGRVRDGVAHCLYTEQQFENEFPAFTDPEIKRAPLEQIVLTAKAAGVDDVSRFQWIQQPSDVELARAPEYLSQIGALDEDGDLTDHGLELRSFADDTDIANLMIIADRFGCAVEMATIVPILKLGGYRNMLRWDKSWNAVTKRSIHRVQRALINPCQDDLEFALKIWAAWEAEGFREEWTKQVALEYSVLKKLRDERQTLLDSLMAHKKDTKLRPVDFALLVRLRILMAYGMPNQIYQLANQGNGDEMNQVPIFSPYHPNPEMAQLHQDAIVEITQDSVCYGQAPKWFVSGRRQRLRRRISPQQEPEIVITASFLTLLNPQWLEVIGKPLITVGHFLSQHTRSSEGLLIKGRAKSRLMIDQQYPLGATFVCHLDQQGGITLGTMIAPPKKVIPHSSYEEVEDAGLEELLEAEDIIGDSTIQEEEPPIWLDLLESVSAEGNDAPTLWVQAAAQPPTDSNLETESLRGLLRNGPAPQSTFEAVVVDYSLGDQELPTLIHLELPRDPDPEKVFMERYEVGDRIKVRVEAIEEYLRDSLAYLVVREKETDYEIVMDPYDVSLIGRNFAVHAFERKQELEVDIEEMPQTQDFIANGTKKLSVRVTYLRQSQASINEFFTSHKDKTVDALIADVRDDGLFLHIQPEINPAIGVQVRLNRLPNRPQEMVLNKPCRAVVTTPRKWQRGKYQFSFPNLPPDINTYFSKAIGRENWSNGMEWDSERETLILHKPMSYDQRIRLLGVDSDSDFRRRVNRLFRYSNELDVQVIDITGIEQVEQAYQAGAEIPVKIVTVRDDHIVVQLDNGLETRIQKNEVTYDPTIDLREHFEHTDEILPASIKSVDKEQGRVTLSLLGEDPLNHYQPGQLADGVVEKLIDAGALIKLESGVMGLALNSELSWGFVERAADSVEVGQYVEVIIKSIDRTSRRLMLSRRLPGTDPLDHYLAGQQLSGIVEKLIDKGALIKLEPEVVGFAPNGELGWGFVEQASDIVQVGQQVDIIIKNVDRDGRRLTLSLRLPSTDPIHQYYVGQITRGTVKAFTKDRSGAILELEPGVDGFLHAREIRFERTDKATDVLSIGDVEWIRITDLNVEARRISLTMRALYQVEMWIPSSHRSLVLGKLKEIRQSTGTGINVDEAGKCVIQGQNGNHIDSATYIINELLAYRIVALELNGRQPGIMLGTKGATKRRIEDSTGVNIQIEGTDAIITAANEYALYRALSEIEALLCDWTAIIWVEKVGVVIGKGGSTIANIRSQTGARINASSDNNGQMIIQHNTRSAVESAIAYIQQIQPSLQILSFERSPMPPQRDLRY